MAGRKSDFTLPKFDDIFSTQEMRDEEKLSKIRDIPIDLILTIKPPMKLLKKKVAHIRQYASLSAAL